MANDTGNDPGSDDVFNTDDVEVNEVPRPQPFYQVYEGSKIVVSKQVGKYWRNVYDATNKAYESTRAIWDEVYRYYNHCQSKTNSTPRGTFARGDSSENIIFSNLNIMLPAIYSRNPNITCTTNDRADEPFCDCLQAVLNAIFQRKNLMNVKNKVKKSSGMGLLTNFGVLKIDWTKKDDSAEVALAEVQRISNELIHAKDQSAVEQLYGQLASLESSMDVLKPGGPSMASVMPHNLIIDAYAEENDGSDANWMAEKVWYPTAALKERFTYPDPTGEHDALEAPRKLIYKPTHQAAFDTSGSGVRDDGLGMVLKSLSTSPQEQPISFEDPERRAYIDQYYTQCVLLWDKKMKRVYLFHSDDWTWPLWVWDDPLQISRFFPYFIISFIMSTGGTVSVGETAYMLDQQDEVNDINRQLARIRRSVFDYFFYNADQITPDEAEQFVKAIQGNSAGGKKLLGVKAGENGKITDQIQAFVPPALEYEQLFNKQAVLEGINRITNTSDALRGVQFKTNTNVASVESYQESMRLSVGAKVDVIEDTVADIALAVAELAIQNYSQEEVASLVGQEKAANWEPMDREEFTRKISVDLVAGSMEKPNSQFKKKEAIEVAQAVGQFAQAAPGTVTKIMLKVLSKAFTEVVIKEEDWAAIDQEIQASMMKGTGTRSPQPGESPEDRAAPPKGGNGQAQELLQRAKSLPPQDQQQVQQMSQSGASSQDILQFINDRTGASHAPAH